MIAILGIDPGPEECGWMLIDSEPDRRGGLLMTHMGSGKVASKAKAFEPLFVGATCVAIERPRWQNHGRDPVATRAIASNLIETNYVVARIAGMADARGLRVFEIPAQTWRLGLLKNRSPSDAEVKTAIASLVPGLPKRTNAHERDAGGVAIAAARLIANRSEHLYVSTF